MYFEIGNVIFIKNIFNHPGHNPGEFVESKILSKEKISYSGVNEFEYLTETNNGCRMIVRESILKNWNKKK